MPKRLVSFKDRFAKPVVAAAMLATLFGSAPAMANPSGGTVQAGNANIQTVGPGSMQIEQLTQKAIIDWQRFGIGQGESVQFLQPNQLSVILNRVTGQDPSQILGNLSANGNVFLINPNGILFGPSAVVNVGGLVASTLNISNEDFLNGNFRFTQDANKALASVVNQGTITITDGGYAVLMAPLVSNEGLIVANLGKVSLMSGESATLNFDGRNLINYSLGPMSTADPGTVVVDRETVSSLLAGVIRDNNLTEAGDIVENPDGTVSLVGASGTVVNNGTIQANGAAGQDAGKVVLDSGRLTVLGPDGVIQANGEGQDSNGGEVLALSQGTLKFSEGSNLEAKGSDQGGDGGFIETSGSQRIILEDHVDASATDGKNGQWLIDPTNLTIIDGASSSGDLDGYTDTSGQGGADSTISVGYLEGITGTDVTLQADNQITIADLGGDQTIDFQDGVNVTFQTTTGDILFTDPNDTVRVGGTGSLTMDSGGNIILGKLLNEGTGAIDLTAVGDLTTTIDGSDDITSLSGGFTTVNADGDFKAEAFGYLEIGTVQGDVELRVNQGLFFNIGGPGTVGGDLNIDNDGTLMIGEVNVIGDATITNSVAVGDDDFLAGTDLTASALTVITDAAGTSFLLDADVGSLSIDDDNVGAGGGLFYISNAGALDSFDVGSMNSTVLAATLNNGGSIDYSPGALAADGGMDVGAFSLTEASGDIEVNASNFSNARGTNVEIVTPSGEIYSSGTLTTAGNATFTASSGIGASGILDTNVAGTLSIDGGAGDVRFTEHHTDGPSDLFVKTDGGHQVSGSWDTDGGGGGSSVLFIPSTQYLYIDDESIADTNLTFETSTGDIKVEFVDVGDYSSGDLNTVTLIADTGNILDFLDPGGPGKLSFSGITNANLDIRGDVVNLVAGGSIGTSTDTLEIDALDSITSSSVGDTYLDVISTGTVGYGGTAGGTIDVTSDGSLDINSVTTAAEVSLVTADDLTVSENIVSQGDIAVYSGGNIQLGDTTGTTRGVLVAGVGADGVIGGMDDATATVSLEAGVSITDGNGDATTDGDGDGYADGANIIALGDGVDSGGNVVLRANGSIGDESLLEHIETDTLVLAAFATGDIAVSEQDLVTDDGLTIGALTTAKGGVLATGLETDSAIRIGVASGDLRINEDISTTDPSSSVSLFSSGDIIVGNDTSAIDADADSIGSLDFRHMSVVLVAGGDIVDNNGVDNAALYSGSLVLVAGGSVGDVQFNPGAAASGNPFEISSSGISADVAGDINLRYPVLSLGSSSILSNYIDSDGTSQSIDGITAGQDVCIDQANTSFMILGRPITSANGSVALNALSDILINGSQVTAADTVSIETGGAISIVVGSGTITAPNVVLDAATGIGDSSDALQVNASNLAARNSTSGDIYIDATNPSGSDLTITELSTLKSGDTITGVSGAEDVNIVVDTDNLQVSDDVSSQSGTVYLKADGNITVGDDASAIGTDADQITGPGTIVLEAGGDIVDNNGDGNLAVDAGAGTTNGKVGLVAGGSVGDVQFNAGAAASGSAFEIDGAGLGAQVTGDINIATPSDRIYSTQVSYTDSTGATVSLNGVTAGEDLCLDATSGVISLSMGMTSTNASVALKAASDVIVSYGGITAADTISVESGGEIRDDSGGSQSLTAPNVVLDAAHGIGDGFHALEVNAANLAAANSTDGNIKIEATNPAGSDLTVTELSTLKSGNTIDGVRGAEDIEIDVDTDNLLVNENVVSGSNLALRAAGDIQLGDTTGTTRGVLVAGVGADGVIGGMDDVTATVSLESNGSITDGNGDSTVDGDGDGFADGANIIALGDGKADTGGNVALKAYVGIGSILSGASDDLIETDTLVVAAFAAGGDVNLSEQDLVTDDGLTIGNLVTTLGASTLTGLSGFSVGIDVADGDLRVNDDVTGRNSSVYLSAAGDIVVGDDPTAGSADADVVSALNYVVLDAGNDIQDNNGVGNLASKSFDLTLIAGGSVGSVQFDPGSAASGSAFEYYGGGNNLAAYVGEDLNVTSSSFLQVGSNSYIDLTGATQLIDGITAGQEVCLGATRTATIDAPVTSTNSSVAIKADTQISLYNDVSAADTISLETAGKIRDYAGNGQLTAPNVVIDAGTGIGESSDVVKVNASNLAARNTTSGDIYIDATNPDSSSITVTELSTLKSGNTITGVSGVGDICIDVVNGAINVDQPITSTSGSIALRTQDADGNDDADIVLNGADVSASASGKTVSLNSANQIIDTDSTSGSLIADNVVLLADTGIGNTSEVNLDTTNIAAQSVTSGNVNLSDGTISNTKAGFTQADLSTLKSGTLVSGIDSAADICLDLTGDIVIDENIVSRGNLAIRTTGDLQLGDTTGTTRGVLVAGVGADGAIGGGDDVTATVSLESGGDITDGNGDSTFDADGDGFADGANIIALGNGTTDTGGNVVLKAGGGIGSDSDELQVDTSKLAAESTASGGIYLQSTNSAGTDVTVTELSTIKGGGTVTGLSTPGDIVLDNLVGLVLDQDVTSGGDIELGARGDITIKGTISTTAVDAPGDTSPDVILVTKSQGSILDGNGDGLDIDAGSSGDLFIKASGGIGSDKLGNNDDSLEINAEGLTFHAAYADTNLHDLDFDGDGLNLIPNKGVSSLFSFRDTCIVTDVGDITVSTRIHASNNLALDSAGAIILNDETLGDETTSLQARGGSIVKGAGGSFEIGHSYNLVLAADGSIGTSDDPLTLNSASLAVSATDDVNIEMTAKKAYDVEVTELTTLKGGDTITGISTDGDIRLVVSVDNLKISDDVVSKNGSIYLETAGDLTVGDDATAVGTDADQIIGPGTIVLKASGDIIDKNGAGNVAVDAGAGTTDGKVGLVAGRAVGDVKFNAGMAASGSAFEISGSTLGATAKKEINIATPIDRISSGLVSYIDSAGSTVDLNGVTAGDDLCLDATDGTVNLSSGLVSTSGSVAVRAASDVIVSSGGITAADTISVESGGEIRDDSGGAQSLTAPNVVLDAAHGIGDGTHELEVNTANLAAANSTDGNIKIEATNPDGSDVTISELSTLKSGNAIDGVSGAEDIEIDIDTDNLKVDENVVSGGDLALRASGNIQLGDTTGTTRGVLVAGVGADGAVGGDDDVTATVSVEAGGAITDGNGDDTTDGDGDGYADGANIIALGGGSDTGGNIVITGDSIGDKDPIETDALVLAASSDDGNLRVAEQDLVTGDGLTIGELTTKYGGTTVTGLSTNTSLLSVEVAGGDLRVNEDIAGNVTVFLSAAGDITVGDDPTAVGTDADQIDASLSAALFAGNDIVDNNGTGNAAVRSSQVGLVAGGSVGDVQFNSGAAASGNAFEIEGDTLAADVTGALNVFDGKSVATGPVTYYDSSGAAQPLDAVTAGQDLCLEAAGDVLVNSAVTSTNESVALKASGDIALDGSVSAADTISAEAGQKILSNSSGSLTATNVVLDAAQDIGDSSNAIQVNASNLAARNTTSGDISIEGTNPSGSEVTIAELSTLKGGNTISGVCGTEDVNLVIDTDGLQVHQDVTSAGGNVAISAAGDLTIGDGSGGTTADDTESVSANGTVSLEAASIVDANGAGGPASVAADTLVIDASNGVGSSADNLTVDVDTLAARVGTPGLYVQDVAGDLTIGSATTLVGGVTRTGVASSGSTYLDVLAGDLILDEAVFGSTGKVALRAAGDIDFHNENSRIYAGSKVSLESVNGGITNTLHDGTADVLLLGTYGDLVISVDDSVGSAAAPLEVQKDGKLAVKANGDVFVEDITATPTADLVISELALEQSGGSVSGISAGGDVSVTTGLGLGLDADVVGGTAGGASEVALKADGDITIGDGANGQVRNATADSGNRVSLFSSNGSIVDNNGDGVAAVDANGGDVVASASSGSIGTTDFAGTSSAFEIDAARLAATSGDDVNIVDLDSNGDGLHISRLALANGGGDVTGIFAPNDICLDVVNGDLTLDESVLIDNPTGRIALRTQDLDGTGEAGDILLDGGSVNGTAGPAAAVSIESAGTINSNGAANVAGDNTVLTSADGIGTNGNPLEVIADNLAASSIASGDINMTVETDSPFGTVRIEELTTLKGGATVSGVSAAEDVGIEVVSGNNLQLKADVVGGIAGSASEVALKADGDITIGDGANGQVRNAGADSGNRVSLFSSNGDIIDNNGDGVAAVDANGGDVVASATNGTIGTTDFAGTATTFEIDAARLAATSGDDINVLDLDTKADGLSMTALALANGGGDVKGVTAANDVCLDVVGGDLDVDQVITASGGAVALNTRSGGINLNGFDVTANTTASLESAGEIKDTVQGTGSVVAPNLVLDAENGIGGTAVVEVRADNLAAITRSSGGVNIIDGSGDLTVANGLTTLKGGNTVDGVTAANDVCIDTVGALQVSADITSTAGDVALRAQGGDATVEDGDTVTAQNGVVSVESSKDIVDNNGAGKAALVAGTNAVLSAGGDIKGTAGALEIEAQGLAAKAGGTLMVDDLSGDLRIVEDSTLKTATALDGVTAGGMVCMETKAGSLDVANQIASDDAVALKALNDVNLSGADNITVNDGGQETASLEAGQQISSSGDGIVDANKVVLKAGSGIGTTDPVEIEADDFSADGGTGRVNVKDVAGGLRVTTLDTLKGGDTVTGAKAAQDVCLDAVGGDLTVDEEVKAGTLAALKADGDIVSNATTTAANKVSVESTGGAIVDGNGDGNNFVADQIGLKADGNIGSKTDAIDIDSNVVAAKSVTGELNLRETSGDMNLGDVDLAKGGGTLNNLSVATDISLIADDGTVKYTGLTIEAPHEIAIRTRDTLVTDGVLKTKPDGRVSIEVTDGGIQDPTLHDLDIQTGDVVLKAQGDIGGLYNPLNIDANRLAAQSKTGRVDVEEKNGLVVTNLDLSLGGGAVNGISAAQDVDLVVNNGDLDLGMIAGKNVRVTVDHGNITDGNGPANNITAANDVRVEASGDVGKDDPLEITAGGKVVVISQSTRSEVTENSDTLSTLFVPYSLLQEVLPNFVLPPGVFAQDNVKLGEKGFYLDVLYGYLTPEQIQLIIDRLNK